MPHPFRVVVVGSTNVDLVLRMPRLPRPGETVLASSMSRHAGGKGANQAVALARLKASVTLCSAVGADEDGRWSVERLVAEGVDTSGVRVVPGPTGLALVTVDEKGENSIIVLPGANSEVVPPEAPLAADAVLISLEIPLPVVVAAAREGQAGGARVVLNAAPAQELPTGLLRHVDVLVVNETEWQALGATASCDVVVTLGARGAQVHQDGIIENIPAPAVTVVDATGAGDCFAATLTYHLCAGRDLSDAARQACVAAADSVTRLGARG